MQDDSLRENASAGENVGLEVRVSRKYDGVGLSGGRQCQWCLDRCGDNMTSEEALHVYVTLLKTIPKNEISDLQKAYHEVDDMILKRNFEAVEKHGMMF